MNTFAKMLSSLIAMSVVGTVYANQNSWTGFYVGADAGFIFNHAQLTSQHLAFTNPSGTYNTSSDFSTFSPGVQLGYLYPFSNDLVSGIEANVTLNANQIENFNNSSHINPAVFDRFTFRDQLQTSIKGRLGRALNWKQNILLPYLTAGASVANVSLTYKNEGSDFYSGNATQAGWLIGAGIEWAFRQRWSLRAEYDYIDYGNVINLNIPNVYGLLDSNGSGHVNLSSNNVAMAINYWI